MNQNKKIASVLEKTADYLEIKGENQYRVNAYRNAAQSLQNLSENIGDIIDQGKLEDVPDIGESIAGKIEEIHHTGNLEQLQELQEEMSERLPELLELQQVGPERAKQLYDQLNIEGLEDLKKASEEDEIRELKGFGKKTEEKIEDEIKRIGEGEYQRFKLAEVEEIYQDVLAYLEEDENLSEISIAGSFRRKKATIGDIDVLAASRDPRASMDHMKKYDGVAEVLASGESKTTVRLEDGIQVDLRLFQKKSLGAAQLYFTGSKSHNVELRKIAKKEGLKINEYGLFDGKKQVAGKSEEEIYEFMDMEYIAPELRENRGEIKAAQEGDLPKLLEVQDLKGDLHSHSKYSDGKYSIEEMAEEAKSMRYEYLAVTDHSKKVTVSGGLNEKDLERQIEHINDLNQKLDGFRVLKSIECDILEDGSLDLSNEILKELDLVVCSIHYNQNLTRKKQTKRVIKAMENPYFNIWGHPTGRILGSRKGYDLDMDALMDAAVENNCFFEINANPRRLDLNDVNARKAKDKGVKLAVSTDAHALSNLKYIKYGVGQARRAWMEKSDILNTRSWQNLKKILKKD